MTAILLIRFAYLSASLLVLLIFAVPSLRSRFLDYGARSHSHSQTSPTTGQQTQARKPRAPNFFSLVLDFAAGLRVPHAWFASFYAVSVASSLFWASQVFQNGSAFRTLAGASAVPENTSSMTFRQVLVVWALMLVQGSRRLFECLVVSSPSSSQMWVGHWLLGIVFYILTGIAVWIDGTPELQNHPISVRDFSFEAPDVRNFIGFVMFLLASGLQHDCHAYLASLKSSVQNPGSNRSDYRLPEHPAFNMSLTPHYFAECLIYLSLSIIAAPSGTFLNYTLLSAVVFVVVNLGVTAYGTKQWYEKKFGTDTIKGKARMIPFIY